MKMKLSRDELGIDLDYRLILKDFSGFYNRFDSISIENLINPKLNYEFWDKLIKGWIKNNQVDTVVSKANNGIIPGFEEKIAIDWLNLKKRDYNYQWRLHSFDFCPLLVSSYVEKRDTKYINIIFELLDSWKSHFIDKNFPEEIFSWNDHASANRLLNLTYLLFFLLRQPYDNKEKIDFLKNIVLCHIVVLSCRNFYSFHTNHGLFQAHHTYVASTLLRHDIDSCNFQEINFRRMAEEFNFSFTNEAVHKENSPEYHFVIFKNFLQFNDSLKQLELDKKEFIDDVNQFALGALKFLAYAIKPNGFLPTMGDTEEKQLDNLPSLKDNQNYPFYLYAQSKASQGSPLPYIACAFAEAGYFFIKTNYSEVDYNDQFYLAAKSGFLSKYHRQDDDCHFVLSAFDDDWLVDGGLYRHEHHDPIREFMRSRYSHNLMIPKGDIFIERQNPPQLLNAEEWGLTHWMNTPKRIEATLATRMFNGFDYRREFVYQSPYKLKVSDIISKLEDNPIDTYQLVFNFSSDKKITVSHFDNCLKVESNRACLHLKIDNFNNVSNVKILIGNELPGEFIQKISKNYNILDDCQTAIFEIKSIDPSLTVSVQTNIEIEKKDSCIRVFILGSCVTRDAFELAQEGQFKIAGYLARTSMASTFQEETVTKYDTSIIKSNFQRRMVDNDLLKKTTDELGKVDFDFLVIDLIDERFDVVKTLDGKYFTLSSEFKEYIALGDDVTLLKPNDNELFDLWCRGWDKFIQIAKSKNFYHKICINKVFWSNKDSNEEVVFPEYQNWINKNNAWLERLYSYIEKSKDIKIVFYSQESFRIDRNHKWGAQPYHYADTLYLEFLEKLMEINK